MVAAATLAVDPLLLVFVKQNVALLGYTLLTADKLIPHGRLPLP